MTIVYKKGDILKDDADYLVIPVNTKGAMGAGLAKSIAKNYPYVKKTHRRLCLNGDFSVGKLKLVTGTANNSDSNQKWFVLFPTKKDWKNPSKLSYIESGLHFLKNMGISPDITFAFPKLGCGLGGLNWENDVKPLIESYLSDTSYEVRVYEEYKPEMPPVSVTPI